MAEPDTGRTAPDDTAPDDTAPDDTASRPATTVDTERTTAVPVVEQPTAASVDAQRTEVLRPAEPQPVMEPAVASAPEPPKRRSNRLAGTAWVLLAAGLFQVVYFAALAGLVALFAGPSVVPAQLAEYTTSPFAWLPVLFFFLLFELTVLISNRAGRFLYVVMSLVVGLLVYLISVLLITAMSPAGFADTATLQQALLNPLFVLTGLVAREVMLWTGVAIGARGTRLRKRNRAARESYRAEVEGRHA